MKVVSHQRTDRTMILPRDLRRPGQDGGTIGREPACRFDGRDELLHPGECVRREENRHLGEEVGPRMHERLAERCILSLTLQRLA